MPRLSRDMPDGRALHLRTSVTVPGWRVVCRSSGMSHRPAVAIVVPCRIEREAHAALLDETRQGSPLTVPSEATTMKAMASHCVGARCSRRMATPATAAIAGSKLMNVPNVPADRRRSATISSV
jgi:hypothetical protein